MGGERRLVLVYAALSFDLSLSNRISYCNVTLVFPAFLFLFLAYTIPLNNIFNSTNTIVCKD